MALVASSNPPLYLKGTIGAPTRSIEYELTGTVSGSTFTLADALGTTGVPGTFNSIADFFSYSACSETTPSVPTGVNASWIINGVIQVFFTQPGNADGVDLERSTNGSSWGPFYNGWTAGSPFSNSNSCSYTWYRVRAYNCAGSSNYSNGANAGACPP